ncbi:MAG TPA: NUDIX hydrolase [Verrucomicrobiae bacterium]|nr:NUDIX hydrolase [Verrucomicrobiae bacterium]
MAKKVHAVGVFFENRQGQILVLKRHPQTPEGGTWGLVGGKVDPEEDIVHTAIRKTHAEIGYAVDPSHLEFLKTYHWDRDDLDITFDVFRLNIIHNIVINIDPLGSTEYKWSYPRELQKQTDLMLGLYPILEDIYQAKTV